ncbi:MAG: CbtB domain-containing protein, partial [Acidimicrobiia bacterium]
FDGGVVSSRVADSGMYLHEVFHDGRHLLGVPCH